MENANSRRSLSLWGQAWAGALSGRRGCGRPQGGRAGSAWCPRTQSCARRASAHGAKPLPSLSRRALPSGHSAGPLCRPPPLSLVSGTFPASAVTLKCRNDRLSPRMPALSLALVLTGRGGRTVSLKDCHCPRPHRLAGSVFRRRGGRQGGRGRVCLKANIPPSNLYFTFL